MTHNPMRLSDRQQEVMQLLALGLTAKEIAGRLGVSEASVNMVTRKIRNFYGARTLVQAAVMWAREQVKE